MSSADTAGDGCEWYTDPAYCSGTWDDDDFSAVEQCCMCGGGLTSPYVEPAAEETVVISICYDDMSTQDTAGDGCEWYTDVAYCEG